MAKEIMRGRSTHLLQQAAFGVLRAPRFWGWGVAAAAVPPLLVQLLPVFPSGDGAMATRLAGWAMPALGVATVLALITQQRRGLVHPYISEVERFVGELVDHGTWQLGTLAGLALGASLSGVSLHVQAPALLASSLVLGAHLLPIPLRQTGMGPSLALPVRVALGLGAALALSPLARLGVPAPAWLCLLLAAGLLMRDPRVRGFA